MHFDRFLQQICPLLDLQWRKYRRRAARHRVGERMRELGLDGLSSYLQILREDPAEAAGLADLMRVTVSRFFRDRQCWARLGGEVLPQLIAEKNGDKTLRVWSAGCCGGEEPYGVALLWLEYLRLLFPGYDIDILATDIDEASLARASRGAYGAGSLHELPEEIRERWFHRKDGMWLLDRQAKELVRFEKSNLMTDPLPSGIDLALCRYLVFTYYRGERRFEATRRLWSSLRPQGVLMIGLKESIDTPSCRFFEPWPGNCSLFRRKGGGTDW